MIKKIKQYGIHLLLFVLTVFTTLIVGAELTTGKIFFGMGATPAQYILEWNEMVKGASYSFAFLLFLTVHEFGHYLTAMYYRVKATLPFYIPIYIPFMVNIGSLGAVIRLKSTPDSTRKFFDIGIAGPLAGFVISVGLLIYGFTHLPQPDDYILGIHPEYVDYFGGVPTTAEQEAFILGKQGFAFLSAEERMSLLSAEAQMEAANWNADELAARQMAEYHPFTIKIGNSLLYEGLKQIIPYDANKLPDHFEMIHYPWLFVGYITLFFTALNLLPIGQLDGGHITYGMFGRQVAGKISRLVVLGLVLIGGTGLMDIWNIKSVLDLWPYLLYSLFLVYVYHKLLYRKNRLHVGLLTTGTLLLQTLVLQFDPSIQPSLVWLLYSLLAVRFIGVDHPPAWREHRVNRPRQALGWVAFVIFVLCFTPNPVLVVGG